MRAGFALALAVSLAPKVALAECRLQVSTSRASVGQPVVVQLSCEEEDGKAPEAPSLAVKGAAETRGPTRGTSERMTMQNFKFSRSRSTTFTWTVFGTAPGTVTIGPASVALGTEKVRSKTVDVTISNEPARVQPGPSGIDPFGFDPFDFMRGLPTPRQLPPSEPTAPLELHLDAPRGRTAFLHALVSSTKVVVGEPIHFRVFAYGSAGPFVPTALEEAKTVDFLSFSVELDPSFDTELCDVGGESWRVGKVYDVWLVPLRAGRFSLGRVTATLGGAASYRALRKKLTSEELFVDVEEPPREERPLGYRLGDAGELAMKVEVAPKEIHEGDFVEVVVEVSGFGALPTRVVLPESERVEWQEPRLQGGPKADSETLAGTRRLTYGAKISGSGPLPLGRVELPYFDTKTRKYRVLGGDLGTLTVTARETTPTGPAPRAATSAPSFELPAPREKRAGASPPDRVPAWLPLLFGPPLAGLAGIGIREAWSRRKRTLPKKRTFALSPADFRAAESLARDGDDAAGLRELEKLLFTLLERKFERSFRGYAKEDLPTVLVNEGLTDDLAREIGRLSLSLVEARYAASSAGFATFLAETKRVAKALGEAP